MDEEEKPMCPLLTLAAGKSRPCAHEGCEWYARSFDERYSRCVLMDADSVLNKMLGIMKRASRNSEW